MDLRRNTFKQIMDCGTVHKVRNHLIGVIHVSLAVAHCIMLSCVFLQPLDQKTEGTRFKASAWLLSRHFDALVDILLGRNS